MLTPQQGQVVRSTAGRDRGTLLAVIAVSGQAVTLADGKRRPLERPKVKNLRHIVWTVTRLTPDQMATNRRLRKALTALESEHR